MRETCPRCRWPKPHCFCDLLVPMRSRVKFVILMHVHEDRHVRNGTGRFASLCFEDAELAVGTDFSADPRVVRVLRDPGFMPLLLYPGPGARPLGEDGLRNEELAGRRPLVFVLDATWKIARIMYRENPFLHELPRIVIEPEKPSRFIIKRQPKPYCLSTIEAVHELMLAFDAAGIDRYERPGQLLSVFMAMQRFQIECMERSAAEGTGRRKSANPRTLERLRSRLDAEGT